MKFLGQFLGSQFGKPPEVLTDPRGSIARGACVVAASLLGEHPKTENGMELSVSEVASHSIGIRVRGGGCSVIIPKGTELPCKCTQTYWTSEDNQSALAVDLYEGEKEMAADNFQLSGDFVIRNLPPRPAGEAKIVVELEIDQNGILHMRTVDQHNAANRVTGVIDTAVQQQDKVGHSIPLNETTIAMKEGQARTIRLELLRFFVTQLYKKLGQNEPAKKSTLESGVKVLMTAHGDLTVKVIDQIEKQVYAAVKATGISPVPVWVKD
jgi:molecular chaperone DnaK (HSP70)